MKNRFGSAAVSTDPSAVLQRYRAALVALRTFLGIVYLTNGLAKLFSFKNVTLGPWKSYLIDRDSALSIQTSNSKTAPGFLHDLGNVVVQHWDVMQWLLTAGELAVGIGLLIGFLGRLSAIAGFLLAATTFVFAMGSGTWTYDYLFEPVILAILVVAAPLPGVDSRLSWAGARAAVGRPRPDRDVR